MPAPQTWEEILAAAQLSADEGKLIDKIVQRVPEFKEGRLRQSDYSRQSLELQNRKKEYDDAVAFNERMKGWADEKVPIWESLVEAGAIDAESKPLWPDEKARMAKELEEAKRQALAGGVDMDPAELDKRVEAIVKANGGVTQAELKALWASEGAKLAEEVVDRKYEEFKKDFNTRTIPFTASIAASNTLAAIDYERATGEEFTDEKQTELYALMNKENNMNPRAVMKLMLKPVVEKKAMADEVKRQATEMAAQMLRDRGELAEDQPFIPIPEKTNQPQGSLQRLMKLSTDEEADPATLIAAAASKAAQELRSEGKS